MNVFKRINRIKAIALNFDGTLSHPDYLQIEANDFIRKINLQDLRGLENAGLYPLTLACFARNANKTLLDFFRSLKIDFWDLTAEDKEVAIKKFMVDFSIQKEEILYIAFEEDDLTVLDFVSIFCCPANAPLKVRQAADIVLNSRSGEGCFAEVLDKLVRIRGLKKINKNV
jgi:3-deoxy-D-manno-octulosonate 8-phosphate phosphatase KdsC-like HAD superfamily phosphatase